MNYYIFCYGHDKLPHVAFRGFIINYDMGCFYILYRDVLYRNQLKTLGQSIIYSWKMEKYEI